MELRDGSVRKRRHTHDLPGHAHELTFSCHQRLRLLAGDRAHRWLIESIDRARHRHGFLLWAYVIMPDHVHLVVRPNHKPGSIALILKSIKQPFAQRAIAALRESRPEIADRLVVRWPTGRTENRFWQQGGGYDRNLWEPEAVHNAVNYIHLNPVRAGLVRHAADWEWSSARWYVGERAVPITIDAGLPRLRVTHE